MTIVTERHWESWMGSMPMPEDCEVTTMFAMYDSVKKMEDKEYAAQQIQWYESLWRRFFPLYQENNEKYGDVMKLIKEGIEFFRKELTE